MIIVWGLLAFYLLIIVAFATGVAVCVWLDRRQRRKLAAQQEAFAKTQPIELIREAEAVLEGGR